MSSDAKKKLGPIRRRVASARNSECASIPVAWLDFSEWWTDEWPDGWNGAGSKGMRYLKVKARDDSPAGGDTYHRVYCRLDDKPRLMMKGGEVFWLINRKEPQ